jgi:hypothetical protein
MPPVTPDELRTLLIQALPEPMTEAPAVWPELANLVNNLARRIRSQLRRIERNRALIDTARRFRKQLREYQRHVETLSVPERIQDDWFETADFAVFTMLRCLDERMPSLDPHWSPVGLGHVGGPPWEAYASEVLNIAELLLRRLYPR